jgi:hypothetical protein
MSVAVSMTVPVARAVCLLRRVVRVNEPDGVAGTVTVMPMPMAMAVTVAMTV